MVRHLPVRERRRPHLGRLRAGTPVTTSSIGWWSITSRRSLRGPARRWHRAAAVRGTGGLCVCHVSALCYSEIVKVWLDLPDAAVAQLAQEGQDLSRAALEALAIDAYRMNRVTGYQLCQLLEIASRDDLDRFLKHHGVPLEYTIEDFEREGATSARLWQKRQAELSTEPNRERRPE